MSMSKETIQNNKIQKMMTFEKEMLCKYEERRGSKEEFKKEIIELLNEVNGIEGKDITKTSEYYWLNKSVSRWSHYLYSEFGILNEPSVPNLREIPILIDDVTTKDFGTQQQNVLDNVIPRKTYQAKKEKTEGEKQILETLEKNRQEYLDEMSMIFQSINRHDMKVELQHEIQRHYIYGPRGELIKRYVAS